MGKNLAYFSELCYTNRKQKDLSFPRYLFSYINEKSQTADVPIENRVRCREAGF